MIRVLCTALSAAVLIAGGALATISAQAQKLPDQLTWTAYDVGSGGYNQSVAIGNALKNRMGVTLRVLPGKNDISRTIPLREGKAPFSATGVGTAYMAVEGYHEFSAKDWGPQPAQALLYNISDALLTLAVAKDTGVKTMADLKGKRVAWVVGSPSLNENVTALLAFANLTWDDVIKVEFGGFGQSMDGIINNQVDAAFTTSISGKSFQLASSPRGITYPYMDPNDTEGWKRVKTKGPFFVPFRGTEGAALSRENPVQSAAYPYPILMTYANVDINLVYAMTKAMVELFPDYRDGAPGNNGWDVKRGNFVWIAPFHEGSVKYLKEIGVWKPEHDTQNAALLKRQKVLAQAWAAHRKTPYADDAAASKGWQKLRADALAKAGLPVYQATW